nr:WHG domain-containing protein [Naumannella cuiyingiana]
MTSDGQRMTRRDRRRLETYDEIVTVARDLLKRGDEASVRAIATEMGMTPSALYRYVESVADLHALIARSVYEDVIQTMSEAASPHEGDPSAQLAASATAFREWGLRNVAEFKLIFAGLLSGQSDMGGPSQEQSSIAQDGSDQFAAYFAGIFMALVASGLIRVPDLSNVDDSMHEFVASRKRSTDQEMITSLGTDGPAVMWLFQLAWARLYGVVILEVFGLVERSMIESGALFMVLMRETFESLGLPDDWNRLRDVSRAVADRREQS